MHPRGVSLQRFPQKMIIASALLLLAAGCGGGDPTGPDSSPTPSRVDVQPTTNPEAAAYTALKVDCGTAGAALRNRAMISGAGSPLDLLVDLTPRLDAPAPSAAPQVAADRKVLRAAVQDVRRQAMTSREALDAALTSFGTDTYTSLCVAFYDAPPLR